MLEKRAAWSRTEGCALEARGASERVWLVCAVNFCTQGKLDVRCSQSTAGPLHRVQVGLFRSWLCPGAFEEGLCGCPAVMELSRLRLPLLLPTLL